MPICLVSRSTSTIVRSLLLGGHRSCYFGTTSRPLMPPTPPLEKKWFYKEVWSALQPKVAQFVPRSMSQACGKAEQSPPVALKDLPGPSTPVASTGVWSQRFVNVRDRGFKLAEEYGLRSKLDMAFQQYCRFVTVVKDFFYQKRYKQMGALLDDGMKRLEDKIRVTREGRKLGGRADDGRRQSICGGGKQNGSSGVKAEDAEKAKDEGKIVMKLRVKSEEKA